MAHDASQVAGWMAREVQTEGALSENRATSEIPELFSDEYLDTETPHAPTISQKVLKEFLKLTGRTVVWDLHERTWRLRSPDTERQARTSKLPERRVSDASPDSDRSEWVGRVLAGRYALVSIAGSGGPQPSSEPMTKSSSETWPSRYCSHDSSPTATGLNGSAEPHVSQLDSPTRTWSLFSRKASTRTRHTSSRSTSTA